MPIQKMNCPQCGHRASEYMEHRWECLKCGFRFVYEPPGPSTTVRHVDQNMYTCSVCGGYQSAANFPRHKCPQCGADACPSCWSAGLCQNCREAKEHRDGCIFALRYVLILLVLVLAAWVVIRQVGLVP